MNKKPSNNFLFTINNRVLDSCGKKYKILMLNLRLLNKPYMKVYTGIKKETLDVSFDI